MENNKQSAQSFFTKIENFWYYYKTPVILAAVFIFIISVLMIQNKDSVKTDLNIALITTGTVHEGTINFENHVVDLLKDSDGNGEKHVTMSRIFMTSNEKDEKNETARYHVETLLADRGAVIFLFDRTNYDRFIVKDAFCPLDELMPIDNYTDKLLYPGETPIAFSVKGSRLLADIGFSNDDLYATVLFRRPEDAQNQTINTQYENGVAVLTELLK